jgi:hypothetical protein
MKTLLPLCGLSNRYRWVPVGASLVVITFGVCPALAETAVPLTTLKGLHPYATVAVAYDTNPLRRSDNSGEALQALADSYALSIPELLSDPKLKDNVALLSSDLYEPESDVYTTIEAGFSTEFNLSRQQFLVNGRIYQVLYDRLDEFNYVGGDAQALWKWVQGSLWEGEIGYRFLRKQRDFANENIPTNDMLDRNTFSATANRWLTPRWRLGGAASVAATSFDESEDLNQTIFGVGANLDYVTLAGSIFGVESLFAKGTYPNDSERDYVQISIGPTANWKPTTKTRIKANLAYETLTHDEQPERDFDGLVGRIRATWQATGKTSVAFVLWREFSNLNEESANFAIIDGVGLEPSWSITSKTTLRALASFQRQAYQSFQGANIVSDVEDRVDDVTYLGVWVDWQLRSGVSLSLGYSAGSRESTRALTDYDFQNVQATITVAL